MADKKQLTVAELLARNAKDRPGEEKSPRRRRRSLDEGGISVAELTGNLEKVKATPAEAKHSNVSIDETAPVIPAPKKETATKAASGTKPNALQQPLKPSPELAAIVGDKPLPRGEVVSKVWEYIKAHNLQNPKDKREILADDKLSKVFGKDKVTMFEMNKYLAQHLK